jgi:hypothetical protein
VTKYDLHVEGYHTPLTAEEIAELFRGGRLRRSDKCREVGAREWRTIDELFPLLKYDLSGGTSGAPPTSRRRNKSALDGSDEPGDVNRPISSALKAGWICFGIGLAISWFFPFGHAFFSVALITAVVAMCTHQVNRGLALLVSSFVGSGVCALIFFALVLGTIGMAAAPAIRKADADMRKMQFRQTTALNQVTQTTTQLQSNLSAIATQPALPSFSSTPSARFVGNTTFDQHRQHELAMAQQRQADAHKAADQRKRDQNVWEAERQRDQIRAKEQRLQQLQNSIDSKDRLIREINGYNGNPKIFQEQRDTLLREKAKLQGY